MDPRIDKWQLAIALAFTAGQGLVWLVLMWWPSWGRRLGLLDGGERR